MKTAIIMGTRPEIIKLSTVIQQLDKKNSFVIFTGQHYDYNLSLQFIEELDIRKPDYWMELGYFDMLELMKKCSFIITDSGGIQQEATSPKIRKKVLVDGKTTDSPEAFMAGVAEAIGVEKTGILSAIKRTSKNPKVRTKSMSYGNGNAAKQIVKIITKNF